MEGFKVGKKAIVQAVHDFREEFYHFTWPAAEDYDVKPHTIQQHLQSNESLHSHPNLNRMLNEAQKQALLNYVICFDKIGMLSTIRMFWSSANYILCSGSGGGGKIEQVQEMGLNWVAHFLKRNPQIHVHKQQPLTTECKNAHNEYKLYNHFYCFQKTIKEQLGNLYNMDETGFHVDCGKTHTVLSIKFKKKLILTNTANKYVLTLKKKDEIYFYPLVYKDYITSIECISTIGHCLSFFLIIQSVWVLDKQCLLNNLDSDDALITSESGYSNDKLSIN